MRSEKKFIGFDLGAESGRCVVAILKDKRIVLNEVHRFTTLNTRFQKNIPGLWPVQECRRY